MVRGSKAERRRERQDETVKEHSKVSPVQGKTAGQRRYLSAIKRNEMTVAVGPAGTGKTYIAASYAGQMMAAGQIKQIVLCRSAVEGGGERLGFLPGNLDQKMAPWTWEIMRVLREKLGSGKVDQLVREGSIRTVPFAFMRGLTWDNAFVILTEAQNTTPEQMELFTKRLGNNTKAVIEGDDEQTDLDPEDLNGLEAVGQIITGRVMPGCEIVFLDETDIVRSIQCRHWVEGWWDLKNGAIRPTEYAD